MATVDVVRDAPPRPLAPEDTNVIIPESVKRAAALAESFYRPQPDPNAPPATPQPDPNATPVAAATPAPAAPAPAAPAAPPTAEEWENRYKAMKGRYDQSQLQLGEMQQQITQMGTELHHLQTARAAPPVAPTKLITEQEQKDYGDEFLTVVRKAATEEFAPVVDGLKQEVTTLRERLASKANQDVWAALDQTVPEWRTINKSPAFINWLSLRDTYSGAIRRVLLNDAFRAADAPRVLSFFRGFVTDEAATGSAPLSPAPATAALAPVRQAAVSLEVLAAPGRAQSSPASAAGEKPVFTRAQIRDFYDDVRLQVYLGRDAEKGQIEQAIFAAQREGRVRG